VLSHGSSLLRRANGSLAVGKSENSLRAAFQAVFNSSARPACRKGAGVPRLLNTLEPQLELIRAHAARNDAVTDDPGAVLVLDGRHHLTRAFALAVVDPGGIGGRFGGHAATLMTRDKAALLRSLVRRGGAFAHDAGVSPRVHRLPRLEINRDFPLRLFGSRSARHHHVEPSTG
jgi:hypothetical protein